MAGDKCGREGGDMREKCQLAVSILMECFLVNSMKNEDIQGICKQRLKFTTNLK